MATTGPTPAVVETVRRRDRDRCARCGRKVHGVRGIDWSIQHRRPRGAGGTSLAWVNQPGNLVILCGSATTGCHGWAESHRHAARALGLLVPLNGRDLATAVPIRHAVHGLVLLDDLGGTTSQEVRF